MSTARDLALALSLWGLLATVDWLLQGAGREVAYYTSITLRFAGIVVAIVLFVALVVAALLALLDRVLGRFQRDNVRLHVGWSFVQLSRVRFPLPLRLRALALGWFGGARATRRATLGLGLAAAATLASRPLLVRLPVFDPIWAAWLGRAPLFVAAALALRALAHLRLGPSSPSQRREALEAAKGRAGGRVRRSVPLSIFVSVVGISVGVWALIVVIAVLAGFQNDLKGKLVRFHPNLEVASRLAGDPLPTPAALEAMLAARPDVCAVSAVITAEAMIASPSNLNVNITVHGIVPDTFARTGPLGEVLRRGSFQALAEPGLSRSDTLLECALEGGDTRPAPNPALGSIFAATAPTPGAEAHPGMVVGSELARSLHVEIGSVVDLISPEGELSPAGLIPKTRGFEVVGIFETGLYEFDLKTVYVAQDEARRFFGTDVNRLQVRLTDLDRADALRADLAPHLPAGVVVRDWKQFNRNLFSALALEKLVMLVVLGFVILVASFNIMSSLATVILGRTRDIAILRAMGMSRRDVFGTFRLIGLVVGVFGAFGGAGLGWASCVLIDWWGIRPPVPLYLQKIPVDLEPLTVLGIVAATLALSFGATWVPARRAAAILPTEGLRDE